MAEKKYTINSLGLLLEAMKDDQNKIFKKFSTITELETKQEEHENKIIKLDKAINGNGQPGIKQELTELRVEHKDCKENRKGKADVFFKWLSSITALAMLGVTVWLVFFKEDQKIVIQKSEKIKYDISCNKVR
tara:strand:- start:306 stop:704 length:399 start_codon:yes stop_codon:yes gene_type:complete